MAISHDSRQRSNGEWISEREEALFEAFALLNNAEEARDFLRDLFTITELQHAAKRWCVARRLLQGTTQVEAAELCQTDKNTANRASTSIIRQGTGMSRVVHERMMRLADQTAK